MPQPLTIDDRKRQFYSILTKLEQADSRLINVIKTARAKLAMAKSIKALAKIDAETSAAIDKVRTE